MAVHGSYRSLEKPGELAREYEMLGAAGFPAPVAVSTGYTIVVASCSSSWLGRARPGDATSGHPEDIGYRNGAAIPFLPYDFDAGRPHPVVEIPLVVMERALCKETADPGRMAGSRPRGAARGWPGRVGRCVCAVA